MSIVLKVDVDTYRGTREGVPRLLALFAKYDIKATFLFSLGPDNTGRALKRIFRPGFFSKVARTSVLEHYGLKTLLYGVLLPGPHIAKNTEQIMRSVVDAGHEVGVHCYDHVHWQDNVRNQGEDWTRHQLNLAMQTFEQYLGCKPTTIGAAGWQLNDFVPHLEAELGFTYASDTRGDTPFFPQTLAATSSCMQIPTTLPTMDELLGANGISSANIAECLFQHSLKANEYGHVYTLHAEMEGMKLLPAMDQLIQNLIAGEQQFQTLADRHAYLSGRGIPRLPMKWAEIEGRSGELAMGSV